MDLCIDARMAFNSGIGTYIRQLVPLLKDFRITLLVDHLGREWCQQFKQIHFPVPIYSLKEQVLYPFKIPKCDLFWSPHYNIPFLPIQAKKRIVTIHDACHLALGTWAQKKYAKLFMQRAITHSDCIITDSEFSKQEFHRFLRVGKKEIAVIPIAANQSALYRKEPSEEIRKKYSLPEKFVLFVGNRKPHKNVDGLERALKKVKVSGLELISVGKGNSLGIVPDEDLPFLYSMAEAFVFPSFYEGFGLPPLEAMSCGCPTIVSNRASIPEVCGDASQYFDPDHEDEIASAITKVLSDPVWKMSLVQKGYDRVKRFDWKKTAEQHSLLFSKTYFGH